MTTVAIENYAGLASAYCNFLVALGGVSVTVLTLVLGLRRSGNTSVEDKKNFELLVTALVLATIACFVGAHLMAETSAIQPPIDRTTTTESVDSSFWFGSGDEHSPVGWRISTNKHTAVNVQKGQDAPSANPAGIEQLFMIASPPLFIAVSLFLSAIVLLPTAHGSNSHDDLATTVGLYAVRFMTAGMFIWVVRFIASSSNKFALWLVLGICIVSFLLYLHFISCPKNAESYVCVICLMFIFMPMLYFAFVFVPKEKPSTFEAVFYGAGTLPPPASLIGLAVGMVRRSQKTRIHQNNQVIDPNGENFGH